MSAPAGSVILDDGRDRRKRWSAAWFWVRAVPAAWLFAVMVSLLLGRFQFAFDVQLRQCLPGHRIFLIDRVPHEVRRGEIIVFAAGDEQPLEPRGVDLGKIVVGLPGDHVRVAAERTEVNGVVVGYGLLLADKALASMAATRPSGVAGAASGDVSAAQGDLYRRIFVETLQAQSQQPGDGGAGEAHALVPDGSSPGRAIAVFEREVVVPPGYVWVMGATVDSYDSRYYGPIPLYRMRGVATGLI
jgi:type IV secretory pathway protease TraF